MITQSELKELLHYDPETGIFHWLKSTTRSVKAGYVAGGKNHKGYVRIGVNKKRYLAHRLAWLYVYGYFPKYDVDHINTIPFDNRISNLREATTPQNQHNVKMSKANKSGVKGVCFDRSRKKWMAQLQVNTKKIRLGRFDNIDDAEKAVKEAREKYHGEYARHE